MSIQIVEIAQPSVIDTVAVAQPSTVAVVEVRQGPAGPAGTGGDVIIDADTQSDGTADLLLLNVETTTAEVTGTLTAPHIHGNLAGSLYAHVRAAENLAKGDPVYVSGSHGSGATLIAEVSKADASNAAKMPAVGIMDAAVSAQATGHMVISGTITEFATNAYSINAELYVAAGGGLTATPPTARAQPVARVERSNLNNGAILVKVNGLSASDATGNTLVRRTSGGDAAFSALNATALDVASSRVTIGPTGVVNFGATSSIVFDTTTYTYATGADSAHRTALGAGATGSALFTAASVSAARATLEILTSTVPTDSTATTQNVWVSTGASVALTSGTWRVQAFFHGGNAASSVTNIRLAASANWSDTSGRRIATVTGQNFTGGATYVASGGGQTSAIAGGGGTLISGEVIAIVKMTGSGTLSMEMTNTAATGTVTCYAGSHIIATKL